MFHVRVALKILLHPHERRALWPPDPCHCMSDTGMLATGAIVVVRRDPGAITEPALRFHTAGGQQGLRRRNYHKIGMLFDRSE
jgi:hypothetical protein